MAQGTAWLPALRRYFLAIVVGNLVWEFAQLPLYTVWKTGSASQISYAALHCMGGDVLIAGASLVGSLLLLGTADWPRERFLSVAAATLLSGIGTTALSEYVNTANGTWAYSDLMPMLPGTGIGLSPLAQWVVIPVLAFIVARPRRLSWDVDLSIMGMTTTEQRVCAQRRPS